MSLTLRTISREQHLAYIQSLPSASHMQVPAWADVKAEWRSENLGWFDDRTGEMVGAGLVLYRQLPRSSVTLAYLPEGPVINWFAPNLQEWIEPMLAHLKQQQAAFSVKMGPPVIIRRWEATTSRGASRDQDVKRLRDLEADFIEPRAFEVADKLRRMGWQQGEDGGAGFGDVQPATSTRCRWPTAPWKTSTELQPAVAPQHQEGGEGGVEVRPGRLRRSARVGSGCTRSRPCATTSGPARCRYFQRMWTALNTEDPNRMRLYFARHNGVNLSAATIADRRGARLVLLRRLRQHRPRGPALEPRCSGGCCATPTRSARPSTTCAASPTRWTRPTTSSV
ncbi:hypothetical protein GCM10023238_19290 [Streptomyces heliomycini]